MRATGCKENKLELEEKNDCQLKYSAVKQLTLEACRRTVTQLFQMKSLQGLFTT